jgi:cellulose biosynthesis protein BcsQ
MPDATTGESAALVGATGGAGTTRLTVELGALLASDGRHVAVLDAAFATQGLADHLSGRIDPDLTTLLTDDRDAPLADGLVDFSLDAEAGADAEAGRLACCPAVAPFERLARAKTPEAARALESRIDAATETFDHVLVDTPPVAANQSVAAVTAADRSVVVAPATTRGRDAVQRMRGRLDDVGVATDAVVSTRGELSVADAALPETTAGPTAAPTCRSERAVASAVADVARVVFDVDPSAGTGHGLLDSVGEYVP